MRQVKPKPNPVILERKPGTTSTPHTTCPPLTSLLPSRQLTETCGPEGLGRGPGRVGSGDARPQQSRPPASEDKGEARAAGRAAPSTQKPGKPPGSRVTDRQPQPGSGSSRLLGSVLAVKADTEAPRPDSRGGTHQRQGHNSLCRPGTRPQDSTPGPDPSIQPQYPTPSTPPQYPTPGLHPST